MVEVVDKRLKEIDGEEEAVNDEECALHCEATVLPENRQLMQVILEIRPIFLFPTILFASSPNRFKIDLLFKCHQNIYTL